MDTNVRVLCITGPIMLRYRIYCEKVSSTENHHNFIGDNVDDRSIY